MFIEFILFAKAADIIPGRFSNGTVLNLSTFHAKLSLEKHLFEFFLPTPANTKFDQLKIGTVQ